MRRHVRRLVTSPIATRSVFVQPRRSASTVASIGDHQSTAPPAVRRNAAGVQLLSPSLHDQVFGVQAFPPLDKEAIDIALEHLKRHGLAEKDNPVLPSTEITLPKLQGKNIEEHFYNIGKEHAEPYLGFATSLAHAELPQQPEAWAKIAGWVRYELDGSYYPIHSPPDDAMVFDVESLYKLNNYAVMAVAVSEKHWFSWTSPWLLEETEETEQLIPMPGEKPTLIVGHNVGYDRARLQEEYNIHRGNNRFLDTMALHVAVTGLSSHQRPIWMRHKKEKKARMAAAVESSSDSSDASDPTWQDLSSMNSLADVAKLHCGIDVDKSARNWFEAEDRAVIKERFQELMGYCANDVLVTHKVFAVVLPAFLRACPNPVTFAGVLHMGSSFLPVDGSWETFLERAEGLYQSLTSQVESELHKLADEARKQLFIVGDDGRPAYESDPWLRQLDWTPKKAREMPRMVAQSQDDLRTEAVNASPAAKDVAAGSAIVPTASSPGHGNGTESSAAAPASLRSYSTSTRAIISPDKVDRRPPAWFSRFYSSATQDITREGWDQLAPILLKVSCNGYPLRFCQDHGWYYAVPKGQSSSKRLDAELRIDDPALGAGSECYRPKKVLTQTIFNKSFQPAMEKGRISSPHELAMTASRLAVSSRGDNTGEEYAELSRAVLQLANDTLVLPVEERQSDPWLSQLDWSVPNKINELPVTDAHKALPPSASGSTRRRPALLDEEVDTAPASNIPTVCSSPALDISVGQTKPETRRPRPSIIEEEDDDGVAHVYPTPLAMSAPQQVLKSLPADKDQPPPTWFHHLYSPATQGITPRGWDQLAPIVLKVSCNGYPLRFHREHGWYYAVAKGQVSNIDTDLRIDDALLGAVSECYRPRKKANRSILNKDFHGLIVKGYITSPYELAKTACGLGVSSKSRNTGQEYAELEQAVLQVARDTFALPLEDRANDPWLSQLDWSTPGHTVQAANTPGVVPTSVPVSARSRPALLDEEESTESVSETSSDRIRGATEAQSDVLVREGVVAHGRRRGSILEEQEDANLSEGYSDSCQHLPRPGLASNPAETAWPKWYWDLHRPGGRLTIRSKLAPLLLKLQWKGRAIYSSRQHGWIYAVTTAEVEQDRVQRQQETEASKAASQDLPEDEEDAPAATKRVRSKKANPDTGSEPEAVAFSLASDLALAEDREHKFFKLPHKDGAKANVGSPLSKTFLPAFESGTLSSKYPAAAAALEMNAQCSYWTSARDRVMKQFVVWKTPNNSRGFPEACKEERQGMILPQVITMGTVTRRAVESTWLAASNAKKNRLGSELKAMVRAPPGYAIVGADVDSEELWICCVMGDAQFGVHGATAIGWMTLEGTKSAGTDLHSKTASILGITRDMAKVFNYSRIYGAGVKHAVQLLLQSNPNLSKHNATEAAKQLYAATKGLKEHHARIPFNRKYWYGGTESHVFNTLESVAMADNPRTPALGCGITAALAKDNLPMTEKSKQGEDYMPSRINWVVQSSGVDYLHLLMVSMEYLTKRFDINARFMISVHDEIRYLVKEEDKHRAALALQISNLWTRALFSHRLQMESLPQSCAWFSAVDLDHVLRKEVNMDCVTPSQPDPIPHGVSQDILDTLSSTHGGTLFANGRPMSDEEHLLSLSSSAPTETPTAIEYRSSNLKFLEAQNANTKEALERIIAGSQWEDAWHLERQNREPARAAPAAPPKEAVRKEQVVERATSAKTTRPTAAKLAGSRLPNSTPKEKVTASPKEALAGDELQAENGLEERKQVVIPVKQPAEANSSRSSSTRSSRPVTALPLRRAPESRNWT